MVSRTAKAFIIAVPLIAISLYTLWIGVSQANMTIIAISMFILIGAGVTAALIVDRTVTRGMRRWYNE